MSTRDISKIGANAKKKNIPLFEAFSRTDETYLSETSKQKLKEIQLMIINHLEKSKKESAGQILYYFLVDSKLYTKLTDYKTQKQEKIAQNIAKFFDKLKTFEVENTDAGIYQVVDWIDLMMQVGESPMASAVDWKDYNAVNILTVHSSKGLEFPIVFITNLVNNRFPSSERREKIPLPPELIKEVLPEGDFHMQEERRLFYVGMTRAKDLLFFSAANFYGEGKRERKISNFVTEALGREILKKNDELKEIKQLSLIDAIKPFEENYEEEKPINPLKINYISFSHLQTFDVCPLHYKARRSEERRVGKECRSRWSPYH